MERTKKSLPANPKETANPLSSLTFFWTLPIFITGNRRPLELQDMYETLKADKSDTIGDTLERHFQKEIDKCAAKRKALSITDPLKGPQPSLGKALFKTIWIDFVHLGILIIFNEVLRLINPILLGRLLEFFRPHSVMERSEALWCAGGMVFITLISALATNHYMIGAFHMGMRARVAVCSLIYRKSLRLSSNALGESAPGKVVNLLSNDVNRFDIASVFLHYLWLAPTVAMITLYFLWKEVGLSGILGVLVVFTVMPIQAYTGKLSARFRLQTALKTDERVRFMGEIISGVQVIKMYAWEKPFQALITMARKLEIKVIRKTSYVRAVFMTFLMTTTRIAIFFVMFSMYLLDYKITSAKIFVIAMYFNLLAGTISSMFVRAIAEVAEAYVALKRLQNYLSKDEFVPPPLTYTESDAKSTEKSSNSKSTDSKSPKLTDSSSPNSKSSDSKYESADNRSPNSKSSEDTENLMRSNGFDSKDAGVMRGSLLEDAMNSDLAIRLVKAEARWLPDKPLTLDLDILEIPKGKLIGVIGPVGCGKSSLLQAILRELPLLTGTLDMRGSVSYAAQEPWVFGASVRQNILFGQSYEKFRYNEVVRVCALQRDFEQFPFGDQTLVGERGTSLSGGQKARVNLARAVYRQADIYLLDDPLSAVDAHVGRHLFEQCVLSHLRNRTRVLVTHQLHYLKDAHHIVLLKDGKIEMQGSYHEMCTSSLEYAQLLIPSQIPQPLQQEANEEAPLHRERSVSKSRGRRTQRLNSFSSRKRSDSLSSSKLDINDLSMRVSPDSDSEESDTEEHMEQTALAEASSAHVVKGNVGLQYLRSGASWISLFLVFCTFLASQICCSAADYWMAYWSAQEELRDLYSHPRNESSAFQATTTDYLTADASITPDNDTFAFNNSSSSEDSAWLARLNTLFTTEDCIKIHGTIVALALVITLLRSFSFYNICMKSSQVLHDLMFRGVIRSPMLFFNTNPSGRIMNRFAKDMGNVDEWLPKSILDASQVLLSMVGSIILACWVNPYFIMPILLIGVLFMVIRNIYLKTSKNIKRMEGIARSPVFTHLSATLQGLSTIRAYGAQNILKAEFDHYQDVHTSAWYMFITTSSAFGQCLDMLCLVLITCVIFSFLLITSTMFGDQVGLAITQCMSLTFMVQWGIRQSAEVSNQLMAVERVLEYKMAPPETGIEPDDIDRKSKSPESLKVMAQKLQIPPRDWPEYGRVVFKNLSMKYTDKEEDPYVLIDLNCEFKSKEKIGIVGRTGAGKSSLISTLFRLAYNHGAVIIDGVDTRDISLTNLRKKISIIPQDPVLFSGTLRRNLDPFEEYSDAAVWQALDEVELKEALAGPAGLESKVMDGGSNFSVGQRQLVCLARALLRNNRLLMLDEATANVDPHTDGLIQKTIREKFEDCTVLTVAHRLNTIMDSDRVLVMDRGRMVEFDHPYILLQNKDGFLSKMTAETGKQNAMQLFTVAKENYLDKHNEDDIRMIDE